MAKRKWRRWPSLFTCPTDVRGLQEDDLGAGIHNPVFSSRKKMLKSSEACDGCDYREHDACPGPVGYVPRKGR